MTSTDLTDRFRQSRGEFWHAVGEPGAVRGPLGEADEPTLWPSGSSGYVRVSTVHSGIIATDGLSDPVATDRSGAGSSPGAEIYVESTELMQEDLGEARWLVTALEEAAGAIAGAPESFSGALAEHGLLSLELTAADAPEDWTADGRLGALIGVELPGRTPGFDLDGQHVRALTFSPLRPSELAVITGEGPAGRQRVAEALAAQGWYSYADTLRPAVL